MQLKAKPNTPYQSESGRTVVVRRIKRVVCYETYRSGGKLVERDEDSFLRFYRKCASLDKSVIGGVE